VAELLHEKTFPNNTWTSMVWTTSAIGGATIILLFGLIMFAASLGPARPF